MRNRFCLFILVFLTCISKAQDLLPPIHNYSLMEYRGGSKNWGLATNENGELFVANNMGLLHFNGEKWTLNKLPNNTTIRSVACIDDRIYTGSYEELGFWEKDEIGSLQYTSLTHLIKDHTFTNEEFWEIFLDGKTVIFRSFSAFYIYEDEQIKVIDPFEFISDMIPYQDLLIVAGGNNGLFELKQDKLFPLIGTETFFGKTVTDMVEYEGNLLIGTKLNGCFIFDGKSIEPWNAKLNDSLKLHQLNKIEKLNNGQLAFGTIKNGLYLFDSENGKSVVINRKSGLQNNTVLSILPFKNQLWLGLDNGIARIKLYDPVTYYTDNSGALGMVYDLTFHQGTLYLGSNTGVFYFQDGELQFVNGSQGHVWDLEVVQGDLLCGHNTGTYRIEHNDFKKVSPFSGGYEIKRAPESDDTYIQGTYTGLSKFRLNAEAEWAVEKIKGGGVDFPIKQLCFEKPHVLWAAHPYKGLYRIQLSENYGTVAKTESFGIEEGLPNEYNIKIFNIENQMVFNSEGDWYKYDPIMDSIVSFGEFQKYKDKELLFYDNSHFWFVGGEGEKSLVRTDLKNDSLWISNLTLQRRLAPDSQRMVKINDSTLYITLNDGFASIDQYGIEKQLTGLKLPKPMINVLRYANGASPASPHGLKLSYKNSQVLTFEVSAPEIIRARFQYRLSGPKEHVGYSENGFIEFQNLPYGSYRFNVHTVGIDNALSEPNFMEFEIAPPWYMSIWAIVLYCALALGAIFLVRGYNRLKIKKRHKELVLRLQRKQEEKMAELEKEKLEKEVKLKQNELASTTLNIARKNEMILELKNMLIVNKDKFSNSQRYRSFIKKLNSSVEDTEDWKRFEVNFKELHEDFFERLLQEFPKLTPKDLKLCAYLKMNLSSKEIAPLMAISTRGVEIHRYRLRKKLDLDSSENLNNYLITF